MRVTAIIAWRAPRCRTRISVAHHVQRFANPYLKGRINSMAICSFFSGVGTECIVIRRNSNYSLALSPGKAIMLAWAQTKSLIFSSKNSMAQDIIAVVSPSSMLALMNTTLTISKRDFHCKILNTREEPASVTFVSLLSNLWHWDKEQSRKILG